MFANSVYLPDAIIYFTDGRGATPTVSSRFPILWIVEKEGKLAVLI
jgi:predicted metal-dependent peptidase